MTGTDATGEITMYLVFVSGPTRKGDKGKRFWGLLSFVFRVVVVVVVPETITKLYNSIRVVWSSTMFTQS